MRNVRRLDISITRRPASYRGPRSSEDWTDSFDELIRDLSELSLQWNTGIIKLFETLPDGSDDSAVDAFLNGIDGRTVYVDSSLTSTSVVQTFWHDTKERPKTLKEALEDIYSYLDDSIVSVQADVVAASGGLTTEQKAAIGSNIFDSEQSSSPSSLDGKSENNRQNIIQLAGDLYGTGYTLDNDGVPNLTYSVKQMVNALLQAHGGNWADDIDLVHSGLDVVQADIASSATINDSYGASPLTTEDDLNQIRTQIKVYAGGAAWQTTMPALYTGGADSLRDLLFGTKGSGTKSATNPWGYHFDDIDSLGAVLDAISGFVGQISHTDNAPDYGDPRYVNNGDNLETAIGKLDDIVDTLSGFFSPSFSGLDDTPANYVSASGQTLRVNDTESALEFVDFTFIALDDTPDAYTGASGQFVKVAGAEDELEFGEVDFVALSDAPSSYTGASGQIVRVNDTETALEFEDAHFDASGILKTSKDIEFLDSGRGIVMSAGDGSRWRIWVDNSGNLQTAAVT